MKKGAGALSPLRVRFPDRIKMGRIQELTLNGLNRGQPGSNIYPPILAIWKRRAVKKVSSRRLNRGGVSLDKRVPSLRKSEPKRIRPTGSKGRRRHLRPALEDADLEPDLEVVRIRRGESFKAWSHGYPFHTVRYFIGEFEPGNLVLTGPNLPHNWMSDIPRDASIPLHGRIIQFTERFISDAQIVWPELTALAPLPEKSRRGVLPAQETGQQLSQLMEALMQAQDVRRIELFMVIGGKLSRAQGAEMLASASYLPDPSGYMSAGINKALSYIRENMAQRFSEADLAAITGQSTAAFSCAFRRRTGMTLMQYVKRLRINLACQILMSDEQAAITDICFEVGLNNLSNFNWQFLAEKRMTPSRFRRLPVDNITTAKAA